MVFKLNKQLLSKLATGNGHGENSPFFDGWKAYDSDPYHRDNNPDGVIQMGLAENQLTFGLVQDWVRNNPRASICSTEGLSDFRDIAIFQDYHGLPEFRNAVAKFMGKVRGDKARFDPDRIVMSGGATGAHETIAFCLADPGDAFLVPTPYYTGFDRDLKWRTGVRLIPVETDSSNDFKVTKEALESAYNAAVSDNIRVKGLIITNPSNPLGTILDKDTLLDILGFINDKRIHLVCDEIYAATVFDEPEFVSVSEIIETEGGGGGGGDEEGNKLLWDLDLVHVVYSLSKDMGFPGFRVGIIYSYNDQLVSVARKMSSFGLVSSQTQHLLASMLSDEEFVGRFIEENKRQLARRRNAFTRGLTQVGIGCLKTSNAGLFLWMDLHKLLKEQTLEAEMELWRVIIVEVKLNVSPGSSFHCAEPGWFRVCFANMDEETMEVALARIRKFVVQKKKEGPKPVKKLCWQRSSLKLSFSSKIYDDFIMSPHSPLPQSPLVRATN